MEDLTRGIYILILVFVLMVLFYNVLFTNLPKIPGDIYLDKSGFKIYIPVTSAIIFSVLLSFILNRYI